MAVIVIEPVEVATQGKLKATITGINPTDHDCLVGTVTTKMKKDHVRWNTSGICRDRSAELNLLPKDEDVADVINTAKKLGCK